MTWTKLSDDFSDDCWTLSDQAFRLHVEALVWSNRKLLDLRLPKTDLRRFASRPDCVGELLEVGWWTEDGDSYLVRHHAVYQRTREEALAQQARSRANGAKGGRPPKVAREQALSAETQVSPTNPVANPVANPARNPGGRDRTGQGLATNGTNSETWHEPVAVPGGCSVCHQPYLSVDGTTTHPTCDPLEAIA